MSLSVLYHQREGSSVRRTEPALCETRLESNVTPVMICSMALQQMKAKEKNTMKRILKTSFRLIRT